MVEPFVSACTAREVSEKEVADGNLAMVYLNGLIKGPAAPSTPRSLRESIEIGERPVSYTHLPLPTSDLV